MGELRELPNIGAKLEEQLNEAGIHTKDQLMKTGSREAWLKIRAFDESACLHRLWGIEAAIEGVKKKDLPDEVRRELKEFFDSVKNER
ncbi:TfoX/Sxy family protein [Anaerostipes sp.]|uniref:TfoX/Sxy family protein n=1 Tax=Anaerostipes sp. TaxID=1872530 RepID=UPI0025BF1341|nr:TfoX/Sxy family protein [Anaerostipes sp.]MBS7009678.1 TfoX/Sxy family protein [Anaerostipes sp.]